MIWMLLTFTIVFVFKEFQFDRQYRKLLTMYEKKESEWQEERKQLLDRIQAPTFAEYTNKVIKEKKLEKQEDEPKPVEYIS